MDRIAYMKSVNFEFLRPGNERWPTSPVLPRLYCTSIRAARSPVCAALPKN